MHNFSCCTTEAATADTVKRYSSVKKLSVICCNCFGPFVLLKQNSKTCLECISMLLFSHILSISLCIGFLYEFLNKNEYLNKKTQFKFNTCSLVLKTRLLKPASIHFVYTIQLIDILVSCIFCILYFSSFSTLHSSSISTGN